MARLYTEVEVRRLIEEATAPLLARIAQLEAQLAAAKKDSSTSSKPPSSDIVKPPRTDVKPSKGRKRKRRRGGQPGHERHERPLFPPEQVDKIWYYEWAEASWLSDWEPLDEYHTFSLEEFSPISLNQALPTVLRTPWKSGEAEETESPRLQDLDALARQADRFLSILSGGVTPPREPEGSFLQRGDDQDVSVLRIVLGYGVPALLALGLSLLAFVWRDL